MAMRAVSAPNRFESTSTRSGSNPAVLAADRLEAASVRRLASVCAAFLGSAASTRTPPTSSASSTSFRSADESVRPKEMGAIEKAVEPATGRLAEVETGHACAPAAATPGIECAPGFTRDEVVQEAIERCLEDSL